MRRTVARVASPATPAAGGIDSDEQKGGHGQPGAHWLPGVERVGVLGPLVTRANHFAITVSDVARSLEFYVNVLGLQQIRRPNFDRFGAWLTAGNLEIHLIKGPPVVPEGDHLIVGHLALEIEGSDIEGAARRLREAGVAFRKNVSVPNRSEDGVVTQFFLRDPDGYYVELCNCDVLTKYCLSQDDDRLLTYNESNIDIGLPEFLRLTSLAEASRAKYLERINEKAEDLVLPSGQRAAAADPAILANMLQRTRIWGDLLQGETEESLSRALKEAGNNAPVATRIIRARKVETGQVYLPPAIFDASGEERYQPQAVARQNVVRKAQSAGGSEEEIAVAGSPKELFEKIFARVDRDKTGSLRHEEVVAELRRLSPMSRDKDVAELLAKYDRDGSGHLDRAEFVDMCQTLFNASSRSKWAAIFELCDDDGNAKLTAPELCHKLSDIGVVLADDELDELFLDADTDGSGSFSRDEFVAMMMAE